jgi:hypothetical protein
MGSDEKQKVKQQFKDRCPRKYTTMHRSYGFIVPFKVVSSAQGRSVNIAQLSWPEVKAVSAVAVF